MDKIDQFINEVTLTRAVEGFLSDGSCVCLGLRKRVSLGLGENLIAGIGGKIGDSPEIVHESSSEAMDREIKEEIGVTVIEKQEIGHLKFIFSHKPPDSKWNQDVIVYIITKWQGEPSESESTKPEWYMINDIPWERMWEDNLHWLPLVLTGQQVDGIFLYRDDHNIEDYRLESTIIK